MTKNSARLGSFTDVVQIVPTADDSDLVSRPVDFVAGAHTMQFHHGRTITSPKLVLLICGTDPYDTAKLDAFAKDLMESGYLSAGSYWGFQSGRFLGSFPGPTFAGTVLDSAIRAAIAAFLTATPALPQPDDNTIYAAILPAGVTVQFDGSPDTSCASFCGFHESDPAHRILYTVQPDTDCSGCNQGDPFVGQTMVLAHEVAETCSDPDGTGWYEDSTGMENGDIVAWIQKPYGPWIVQGYADPQGNNVLGAYAPVQQPPPSFTPDPKTVAWLSWRGLANAYVLERYQAGDLVNARAEESVIAQYETAINAMLMGLRTTRKLPAAPPAVPA